MWRDNETELDFLDYDYLIKTVQNIVTNDSLLPASIGIYGDWGSGKSSLMNMCKKQLELVDKNIKCIVFNGWLFENYEDAKTSILGTILDEINVNTDLNEKAKDIIKGLYKSIDKIKLAKNVLKLGTDIFMTGGIASIIDYSINAILQNKEMQEGKNITKVTSTIKDELNNKDLRDNIRKFQTEFGQLLEESKISRLVVFIDELDRCRPDTILDTLEAIKLFLFNGKVAFIIGADERHISYAVKSKFKDIEGIQIDIGKEYLEKLIQYPIRIPRLDADEVEIYLTCLLLESELPTDRFEKALQWIKEEKAKDFESFRIESVISLFKGDNKLCELITKNITVARQLSSVLSNGLHGNPRQCKRFLNSMYMRLDMASYKNKQLDSKILAKIMMLEYIKPRIFNKIAEMAKSNTLKQELSQFENGKPENVEELKTWIDDDWFLRWCSFEPHLANESLNIYFYFTRTSLDEKISRISSTLSPNGQGILDSLLSKSEVKVQQALEKAKDISDAESAAILEAMYSSLSTETSINKEIFSAFLSFAEEKITLTSDVLNYMQSLSGSQINLSCASYVANYGKKTNKIQEVYSIAELWGSTNVKLQKAIVSLLEE